MQSVDEKEQRIQQLENENRFLLEKIKRLEHNVEALTQAVLHASKQRFGTSSEKTPQTDGQYTILGEETIDNVALASAPVIIIKEHKRPVRKKGDMEKLTEGLTRESEKSDQLHLKP